MGPEPVQASAIEWRRGSALGFRTLRRTEVVAFELWAERGKEEQWASGGRRQRKRKAGEDARKISELC
jgi:hypothetical protein